MSRNRTTAPVDDLGARSEQEVGDPAAPRGNDVGVHRTVAGGSGPAPAVEGNG